MPPPRKKPGSAGRGHEGRRGRELVPRAGRGAAPARTHAGAAAPPDARSRAIGILVRVQDEGAWASRLLESVDESTLDPRDLALLQEIVLGVLRWRGALDSMLGPFLRMKLEKMDPAVREALRAGAYQLIFLDRIPAHAAVDTSVSIARRASGPGAAGLVNAVLRKLAAAREGLSARAAEVRGGAAPPVTATAGARTKARRAVRRLAAELSHPEWMVARSLERFGETEARAWMLANNTPPPLSLRPNPRHAQAAHLAERLADEGVRTEAGVLAPGARRVVEGHPARTALFASGAFWIQDEGSQIVPLLFPGPWNGLTADLCAAPGGKAFVLATGLVPARPEDVAASALSGVSSETLLPARVVAFDRHPHRLGRLIEGARRVAPGGIAAAAADLAAGAPVASGSFDRVLVDAPCSGTGVLRRHPEIRWRLAPGHLAELAALQGRLLDTAYALLRPGGHLVYSVCSFEPEEGDAVVEAFLARSGAAAVDPRPALSAAGVAATVLESALDALGRWRTFPHRQGADGFFAALFRRPPRSGEIDDSGYNTGAERTNPRRDQSGARHDRKRTS